MLQKTEKEGIYRDINTGALVNKDNDSLSAYKKQKNLFKGVIDNTDRIKKVENDLNEIKDLLKQILEK